MYIGEKEIDSIKGKIITFKDGTEDVYTQKQQKYLITDSPKDDTQLRDMMLLEVVPELMEILAKHNVKKVDVDAIIQVLTGEYNTMFQNAIGKAFGTYVEGKHPAYNVENVRFHHIHKFMRK